MGHSGKSLLALSLFLFLGFLAFHPALRIGFLGDFAGDLCTAQGSWLNFASYQWNFYIPAMAIYYGLYQAFHLLPLPYQVVHLGFIFFNAWLVYLLARSLQFESWQCWLAGLLALFNSAAFEAYFWLSTIPKVLATTCGLAALLFLNRFRQRRALIWGLSYLAMVAVGITIESTGLILPLLGLILDSYYRPWKAAAAETAAPLSGLRLHLWSFGLAAIFLLIRQLLGIKPVAENLPLARKGLTFLRTVLNTFFHGLSEYFGLEIKGFPLLTAILLLALITILIWAWRLKPGPERRRFITLLLLWLGACLPHTIGAHFHSRYLYFPGVFAALLVVDLLGSVRLRLYARNCAWLAVTLIILGYLAFDFCAFRQSLGYYLEASRIYNAGIEKIRGALPETPAGARLVLIDFPDSIIRPLRGRQGYPIRYRVLVYRNALPAHLHLIYPSRNFTVTFLTLSPPQDVNPVPGETPSSPEEVAKLAASPQTVVCRYSPGNPGNFVIIKGGPTLDAPILK